MTVAAIVAMDIATERPVSQLSIITAGKTQPGLIVKTDADGRAELPCGRHELESCDTSVVVLTKDLVATEGLVTVLWCAYRHSLHLRVVDLQGHSVHGACVFLTAPSLGTHIRQLGCTDHQGLLLAEEVALEPAARLQVTRAGYFPGQFTLPFGEVGIQDPCVDLVIHPDAFEGGLELMDYQGRAHGGARVTALTADVSFSSLPPIVLGETDSLGRLSLPGDIGDYKLLRVDGPTVYEAEIRNLSFSGGAFERVLIPRRNRAVFRTTEKRCKWQATTVSEAQPDAVNAVVLIHGIMDSGDAMEVVSVLPEGTPVNVNVWGDGRHGVGNHVIAQGDGLEVLVPLTVAEACRTIILTGQVDQIADFSIYSRGGWESLAMAPNTPGTRQVRLPAESVSCRITSIDGAKISVSGSSGTGGSVINVTFPARQRVRVHVVDSDRHAITNVGVAFHQEGCPVMPSGLSWRMAPYGSVPLTPVDARGEAEVLLFAGEHRVVLCKLEAGHLTRTWNPLTGGVVTVPTDRPIEIVSPRTRLLKVHVDGPVPRRWNLFALPEGSFITCFGSDLCLWHLGGTQVLEARNPDGTVFARGVPETGASFDRATLFRL